MANLDATIARLRSLPEEKREAMAAQIDLMLDEAGEDLLNAEQWAEIEGRLDADERMTPKDEVVRAFRDRPR